MAKATFPETTGQESTKPVANGSFVSTDMRNALAALFQGDFSALRPRAQSSPDMTIHVNPAVINSYYEQVWGQGGSPFTYSGGNSGSMSAPASNPRYDVVYLTNAGALAIITGSEGASPSIPWSSLPSDAIAIAVIYHKTTATKIVNYEDKDANSSDSYIALDCRPFLNLGGASASDVAVLQDNLALMFFLFESQNSLTYQLMEDGWTDTYTDETGIATGSCVNQTYDSTNKLYSPTQTDAATGGSAVSGGDATGTDLVPTMTTNSAPSPVVITRDSVAAGQEAFQLFDDNTSTYWQAAGALPHWVKVDFGSGNANYVEKYTIGPSFDGSNYPTAWTLEGSNNDSSWTTVDSQTGQAPTAKTTYTCSTPGTYRYYRLTFTAATGSTEVLLKEAELLRSLGKANAFDDSNSTYWASSQTAGSISAAAYIGYNFGSSKTIKGFSIKQNSSGQAITSVKIDRSSDGSSWTNVATQTIVADNSKQTFDITNSTGAQYWRVLANANTGSGSWEVQEVEFFEAPGNMTLVSASITASAQPTSGRVVVFVEEIDSITVNTDFIAYLSRDGGTTYTAVTLVSEGTYASGKKIYSGSGSISAQPSGTTMKYKLVTANNKKIKVHGASASWK